MASLGDIANDVARTLYELRVAVAIVSIAVAALVVVLAHRLGWIAAARRHPRRTGLVAAAALVVLLPAGWYLGSPIFVRTSLVEAGPTAPSATASPTAIPSNDTEPSVVATRSPTAPATQAPTPFAATTLATGEFSGTDEFHFGRGTASIVEIEPGRYHLRLTDFSVRNGPDLFVYLSPDPDGYTDDSVELGKLKATDGSFGYDLPDGSDPTRFRSVLIWCKQFSHLFAVAPFGE